MSVVKVGAVGASEVRRLLDVDPPIRFLLHGTRKLNTAAPSFVG